MSLQRILKRRKPLPRDLAPIAALLALVFFTYYRVFNSAFGAEDPFHYSINVGWNWSKTLLSYLNFSEDWYRPTSLHLVFKLVTTLFSWHDFAWLRFINLLSFGGCVAMVYFVGRKLTPGSRGGPFFGALYLATLPALILVIHHVNSFDFLYQCWLLGALLLYFRHLEKNCHHPWFIYGASWFCFLIALTSKEPSMAFPLFLFLYTMTDSRLRFQWRRYLRILPFGLASGAVALIRLTHFQADSSDYRTVFHLSTVTKNLRFFLAWLFLWYEKQQHFLVTSLDRPIAKIAAVVLFGLAASGMWRLIRNRKENSELNGLLRFAGCWFVAFLAMPLVFGGYPWHVGLSAMAVGLVWGYGVYEGWLAPRPFFGVGLVIVICALAQFHHKNWIEHGPFTGIYAMNEALLNGRRPEALDHLGDETIVLIKNDLKWDRWSYGVGSLFRYTFLKPNWKEALLDTAAPETLSAWLNLKNAICVNWVPAHNLWEDVTPECRRRVAIQLASK